MLIMTIVAASSRGMRKAGVRNYEAFCKELVVAIPDRHLSFEVFSDDLGEMERQANLIKTWGKNVYVKIPVSNTKGETTYGLIRRLSQAGVQVNLTALFTNAQVTKAVEALGGSATLLLGIGLDSIPAMFPAGALMGLLAIFGLALCLVLVHFPVATEDKLLGAVFGGFFVGAGVGLAIRGGGVLDGTEILAVVLSKRTFATVGEVILVLNAIIFACAAYFMGVELALYSMLTYFTASQTIDYLLHGIEAYNSVMIVSPQFEAIRRSILIELGRGVTAFKAKGGYTDANMEVLFCVVTRLELTKLEAIIKEKDENAFVVVTPVLDATGGVIKRRAYH